MAVREASRKQGMASLDGQLRAATSSGHTQFPSWTVLFWTVPPAGKMSAMQVGTLRPKRVRERTWGWHSLEPPLSKATWRRRYSGTGAGCDLFGQSRKTGKTAWLESEIQAKDLYTKEYVTRQETSFSNLFMLTCLIQKNWMSSG